MLSLLSGSLHVAFTTPRLTSSTAHADSWATPPLEDSPCAYDLLNECTYDKYEERSGCLLLLFNKLTDACQTFLAHERDLAMPRGYGWHESHPTIFMPLLSTRADAASVLCCLSVVLLLLALALSVCCMRNCTRDPASVPEADFPELAIHTAVPYAGSKEERKGKQTTITLPTKQPAPVQAQPASISTQLMHT